MERYLAPSSRGEVETKAGANTVVSERYTHKYPRSGLIKAPLCKGAPTAGGLGIVKKLYELWLRLNNPTVTRIASLTLAPTPPARNTVASPLWLKTVACRLFLRCFAPPRRALYTREARYCPLSRIFHRKLSTVPQGWRRGEGAPPYRDGIRHFRQKLANGGSPSGGRGSPLLRSINRYICHFLMSFRPK